MVSNVLGIAPDELVDRLKLLRDQFDADTAYQELRKDLPSDWPV